jgi:hypothetical protein
LCAAPRVTPVVASSRFPTQTTPPLVSGSKRHRRINLCKTCNQCDEIRHLLTPPFSRKRSNPPPRDEKLKIYGAKAKGTAQFELVIALK